MDGSILRLDAPGDGFVLTQNPDLVTLSKEERGCFDCNICLDSAHDPVVTLCGHLFCWPCIYRWLHVQKSSPLSIIQQQKQNCPVCKSNISIAALVPLYGRGLSSSDTRIIPPRPTSPPFNLQHQAQSPPPRYGGFTASNHLANAVMMSFLYPVIGMFGDMVYTRFTNTLPHPYQHAHGNNQRMLLLEKSLHRVSIFFLCCILLCLLFF